MQTFLPYPSFIKSAAILDDKRLGKQRVEALQIVNTILYGSRWRNHPAVKMWHGAPRTLCLYGWIICKEWKARGFKDTLQKEFRKFIDTLDDDIGPSWLGNTDFHLSHRSNLIRKNPDFYAVRFFFEPDNLPYVWPENENVSKSFANT